MSASDISSWTWPASAIDRIGTVELLAALGSVTHGRVYELGTEFGNDMPQGPAQTFYGFRLNQFHPPRALTGLEPPPFDYAMETITAAPHLGTHIDGFAHINSRGMLFGGQRVRDAYGDFGWQANGMETSKPIIGRGILLDLPRFKGVECLGGDYEITPADMEGCLAAQGTEIREGDVVLVRTGWFKALYHSDPETYFDHEPGVGPDAAVWLYDHGMSVIGTDTTGTEVLPMADENRTTHVELLVKRGVHILEIMDLEALAADRVHAFLFIALPLKITGGTGSWLRPVAVI